MINSQRYFYGKTDKLKSRKVINLIFSKGKSFSNYPFRVIWMPVANNTVLQTGVAVSSRNFKRAVDRNRIKRLMREAYRLQKNELAESLISHKITLAVFILYIGKEMPPYDVVFEKFKKIISRLIKITDAAIEENV